MGHQSISLLEGATWDESKSLVVHEIDRNSQNIHELRNDINEVGLRSEERFGREIAKIEQHLRSIDDRHNEDVSRVDRDLATNATRISVLETKVFFWAIVGGAVGTAIINAIVSQFGH